MDQIFEAQTDSKHYHEKEERMHMLYSKGYFFLLDFTSPNIRMEKANKSHVSSYHHTHEKVQVLGTAFPTETYCSVS